MWILAATLAALLLAALIFLALQQGSFTARRSLEIDASPEAVFEAIVDLRSWPKWSPWLLHEPGAQIEYSDDCSSEGGWYSWDGNIVGAGKLTHVGIRPGRSVLQQIEFQRPFKASNEVHWDIENNGETTRVSWEMSGRMPFLMRFMNKRMEASIGRDFELGLAMLGGYLNPAMPHPVLAFHDPEELQDFSYWSIPCSGNLRQLEAGRSANIATLRAAAKTQLGMSLTLYHHFDSRASRYQAENAIPVIDDRQGSNYRKRDFRGGRYGKLTLHGDYKFIPLAWHALNSHCGMHRIKLDPARPALETYEHDPGGPGDPEQAITTLYLPIK